MEVGNRNRAEAGMLAGIGHANLKQLLNPNGCLLLRTWWSVSDVEAVWYNPTPSPTSAWVSGCIKYVVPIHTECRFSKTEKFQ